MHTEIDRRQCIAAATAYIVLRAKALAGTANGKINTILKRNRYAREKANDQGVRAAQARAILPEQERRKATRAKAQRHEAAGAEAERSEAACTKKPGREATGGKADGSEIRLRVR
jgi:hypothetical protein